MSEWTDEEVARYGRDMLDSDYKVAVDTLGKAAAAFDIVGFIRHVYELGYYSPLEPPSGVQIALLALHPAK